MIIQWHSVRCSRYFQHFKSDFAQYRVRQSDHQWCLWLQTSSLHLCCRGTQKTTTRTEQVDWPKICIEKLFTIFCREEYTLTTLTLSYPSANLTVTKSASLSVCVFLLALNLVYIIIPTIPLILLLLTVTGVCCFKLLARRWGSETKENAFTKDK